MYQISLAITGALEKLLPMRIVELNAINLEAVDSIASPDNIVFFVINRLRLVESSSARTLPSGELYGRSYEVEYQLSMRHLNALASLRGDVGIHTSNLLTQLLDLGLSGTRVELIREAAYAGRNVYYLMSLHATAIIAYAGDGSGADQRINRVHVKINDHQSFTVDFDEEGK